VSSSTRLKIDGLRHYVCDGVHRPLPSVTSVLSATQSEETRRKLAAWNVLNPGVADQAAERGTWIHGAVENHIRGLVVDPPNQYYPYWLGVGDRVDELLEGGEVLWSEKPFNRPIWNKYVGDDGVGRLHYYDPSTDRGYAGCPDIIYKDKNGEISLGDFKTSVGPYSAKFPSSKSDLPDNVKKAMISGVFKLKKTKLQLAAYKRAAESCLGITINKTQIIVSTPCPEYSVQVFTFGEQEVARDDEAWMLTLKKFYDQLGV
jgi:hypothetical protein